MARTKELECVKYEIDDEGIAWVTFNRPEKRNAMNPELHFNMQAVIAELETDDDAKVLVITGAGAVFVLVLFAEKKWRRHRERRQHQD